MHKIPLRGYQLDAKTDIYRAWNAAYQLMQANPGLPLSKTGNQNVLAVMPTGSGKTVLFTDVMGDLQDAGYRATAFVHREHLVAQISETLARHGIDHRIYASKKTITYISNRHIKKFGRCYVSGTALCCVAAVDKLSLDLKHRDKHTHRDALQLCSTTQYWIGDEAHHILALNKWGIITGYLEHAFGLGVTATPYRTDGWGLGRCGEHGIFDVLVEGPTMRDLIRMGNLTDYEIFEPPVKGGNVDISHVEHGKDGDLKANQLAAVLNDKEITGDAVQHYIDLCYGKLCVVFCCNIEHCLAVEAEYKARGIPALTLSSRNTDAERHEGLEKFARREVLVLLNYDLFGEGFDLPALEVVQFLRLTESTSLYMQWVGRVLRKMEGKKVGTILDHMGNWIKHGAPDKMRRFTLHDRRRGSDSDADDAIPMTRCRNSACNRVFKITEKVCPHCHTPQGEVRGNAAPTKEKEIKVNNGKLVKVSAEELARARGEDPYADEDSLAYKLAAEEEARKLQRDPRFLFNIFKDSNMIAAYSAKKKQETWMAYQSQLKPKINEWCAWMAQAGYTKAAAQKMFKHIFGNDIYSAQVLRPEQDNGFMERLSFELMTIRMHGGVTYAA